MIFMVLLKTIYLLFLRGLSDPVSSLLIRACLSCGNYVTVAGKVQNMKHVEHANFRVLQILRL